MTTGSLNQAIESDNLGKTLKEMKIDSDLCALLLHYQTHDDYKNPEMNFSKMFKFTFIGKISPEYLSKEEWEELIKPEIQPYRLKIRVIENYEADKKAQSEISIRKGEILTFKSRVHRDVWDSKNCVWDVSQHDKYILGVKSNGETGKFPARCVEVVGT